MNARRGLASLVIAVFLGTSIMPAGISYGAGTVLGLPEPGTMLNLSPAYVPVLMKGVHIHPDNPLLFDFILDTGHSGLNADTPQLRQESEKLIKYFLATLAIPEQDLWVNLSPYEKDRIINKELGQTELGRDMLAQDYVLKQMTASLIYPEKEAGKKFWDTVYAQAREKFGSAEVPVNTFNKVWILPEKAGVFVRNNTAYIIEGHLKVMLEEDYLALNKNSVIASSAVTKQSNSVASQIVRDIVLPELEREVNTGKNFAPLRQIFYSLVLASWYKKNLKEALLNQVYSNKAKIGGVDVADKAIDQKIYQQYLAAYKKGVFNYIKEDIDNLGRQPIPRKYFSGGEVWNNLDKAMTVHTDEAYSPKGTAATGIGKMVEVRSGVERVQETPRAFANVLSRIPVAFKDDRLVFTAPAAQGERTRGIQDQLTANEQAILAPDNLNTVRTLIRQVSDLRQLGMTEEHADELAGRLFVLPLLGGVSSVTISNLRGRGIALAADAAMTAQVGYNNQILAQEAQETIAKYREQNVAFMAMEDSLLNDVGEFLSTGPIKAWIVDSQDETFGIASVKKGEETQIYIERSLLQRITLKGNPLYDDALGRALVFAAAAGTHEQKRVAEFEYVRKKFGDEALKKGLNADYVGGYGYMIGQVRTNGDTEMADEIARRFKEELWEIAVHHLNGDVRNVRVRLNADDQPLDNNRSDDAGDAHVIYFPLAANPLHYGQIETALRAMAQSKASQAVYRVQGFDARKPLTKATLDDRHEITDGFIQQVAKFLPGLFSYSSMGKDNSLDGETDFANFMRLNTGRSGKFRADYLVGSDHMHYFAPNYKKTDAEGNFLPTEGIDTLQKFDKFDQEQTEFLNSNNMEFRVLFNERDPKESRPLPSEAEKLAELRARNLYTLLRGINLEGASSTKIRNALAGFGQEEDLTIMPLYVENEIKARPQYRGFITEIGNAIRSLSAGKFENNAADIFSNWLATERGKGLNPLPSDIAADFNLSDAPLSADEVSRAVQALKSRPSTVKVPLAVLNGILDQKKKVGQPGTSGVRGKISIDLQTGVINLEEGDINIHLLGLYARAFAEVFKAKGLVTPDKYFVVVYDGRPVSDQFMDHFARVLNAYGVKVKMGTSEATTPTGHYLSREEHVLGVINGTASHNPITDNGFKLSMGGVAAGDDIFFEIYKKVLEYASGAPENAAYQKSQGDNLFEKIDPVKEMGDAYRSDFQGLDNGLAGYLSSLPGGASITLDFLHGTGGVYAPVIKDLLPTTNLNVIEERTQLLKQKLQDAEFRTKTYQEGANTVVYRPEPVQQFLYQGKDGFGDFVERASIGSLYFGFDGDSDRLAIWVKVEKTQANKNAVFEVAPNYLGFLLGKNQIDELAAKGVKHVVVAKTFPTSYLTESIAEYARHKYGIEVEFIETPVGSKYFGPYFQKGVIAIGVEESGHIVLPKYFDDAVAEALTLMQVLAQTAKKGQALNDLINEALTEVGQIVGKDLHKIVNHRINTPMTAPVDTFFDDLLDRQGDVAPLQASVEAAVSQMEARHHFGWQLEGVYLTTETDDKKIEAVELREYLKQKQAGTAVPLRRNEGFKIKLTNGAWTMIRISGSEGVIRLYAEGFSGQEYAALNELMKRVVPLGDAAMSVESDRTNYEDEQMLDAPKADAAMSARAETRVIFNRTGQASAESADYTVTQVFLAIQELKRKFLPAGAPAEFNGEDSRLAQRVLRWVVPAVWHKDRNETLRRLAEFEQFLMRGTSGVFAGKSERNFSVSLTAEDRSLLPSDSPQLVLSGIVDLRRTVHTDLNLRRLSTPINDIQTELLEAALRDAETSPRRGQFIEKSGTSRSLQNWRLNDPQGLLAWLDEQEASLSSDAAMKTKTPEGGIDFDTQNFETSVTGEKADVKFDEAMVAQFKRGDFSGVRPVIMSVTPVPSVLPLLGLSPAIQKQNTLARLDT